MIDYEWWTDKFPPAHYLISHYGDDGSYVLHKDGEDMLTMVPDTEKWVVWGNIEWGLAHPEVLEWFTDNVQKMAAQ